MALQVIERSRFLSWVRGGQDDVLAKLMFAGAVILAVAGLPVSIATQRNDGKRIEKGLKR